MIFVFLIWKRRLRRIICAHFIDCLRKQIESMIVALLVWKKAPAVENMRPLWLIFKKLNENIYFMLFGDLFSPPLPLGTFCIPVCLGLLFERKAIVLIKKQELNIFWEFARHPQGICCVYLCRFLKKRTIVQYVNWPCPIFVRFRFR